MKKSVFIFTALFFFVSATTVYGQNSSVKYGTDAKVGATKTILEWKSVLGNDGQNVYAHSDPLNRLVKYNLKTMKATSVEYKLKSSAGTIVLEFALMIKGEISLFSLVQNKKTNSYILQVHTVNKNTMIVNANPRKVSEFTYPKDAAKTPVSLKVCLSPDSSKMLVHYQFVTSKTTYIFGIKAGTKTKVKGSGFMVFDDQFEEVWREESIKTGLSHDFMIDQFAVDNAGNMYMAGATVDEKKGKNTGKPEAYIIRLSEGNPSPVPVKIALPDVKYPVDIRIGINSRSEVVCAGTYSHSGMNNVLGLFSSKIDFATENPEEVYITEFDMTYLSKGLDASDVKSLERKVKKGDDFESYGYNLSFIRFLNNGTFILDAGKSYSITIRDPKGLTSTIYIFGNIMVANFKENASLNWLSQTARETKTGQMSVWGDYALVNDSQDNLHLIYNLMDYSPLMGIPIIKNTQTIQYSLNAQGESRWKELCNAKTTKIVPRPGEYSFIEASGTLFITANKGLGGEFGFLAIPIK
ncbi:MAG: hypothetical protein LBQ64_02940 [Bacteroidales bacterium]|jgi:hypothetical protein|nr:hypothetical protein [Bacteroidales bacterium]